MSTSCSAGCVKAQLPSGSRPPSRSAVTVPVKLPAAAANWPVPAVNSPVCCSVNLNRQLSGLNEVISPPIAALYARSPQGRPDRRALCSRGRWADPGAQRSGPTPLNTPLATTTLLMTVRVPDTPEATMLPLNDSPPLVAAAAGVTVTRADSEPNSRRQQSPSHRSSHASPTTRTIQPLSRRPDRDLNLQGDTDTEKPKHSPAVPHILNQLLSTGKVRPRKAPTT